MNDYEVRLWRRSESIAVVQSEEEDSFCVPDLFAAKFVNLGVGDVVYLEVKQVGTKEWELWRVFGVTNPLGPDYASAMFTSRTTEEEILREFREIGQEPPPTQESN